jgi:tetratricopeptide (TPR) repeat protein
MQEYKFKNVNEGKYFQACLTKLKIDHINIIELLVCPPLNLKFFPPSPYSKNANHRQSDVFVKSNEVALHSPGASLQRQGKYKEAINYHSMVLNISKMTGEDAGVTEAYGAIADCYTELGELEKAGKFYDKYIARLENE